MTKAEFDEMIRRDGKDIMKFCYMEAGNSIMGDELYQDTMLTLWEQREKLIFSENVKSYALSVSIHIWKNRKRKYARRMRIAPEESYEGSLEFGEISGLSGGADENPEMQVLQMERAETVRDAVRALPEKYRQVIYLKYTAELSTGEISGTLHVPENTVRTRLRKAKELLKERLEAKKDDRGRF